MRTFVRVAPLRAYSTNAGASTAAAGIRQAMRQRTSFAQTGLRTPVLRSSGGSGWSNLPILIICARAERGEQRALDEGLTCIRDRSAPAELMARSVRAPQGGAPDPWKSHVGAVVHRPGVDRRVRGGGPPGTNRVRLGDAREAWGSGRHARQLLEQVWGPHAQQVQTLRVYGQPRHKDRTAARPAKVSRDRDGDRMPAASGLRSERCAGPRQTLGLRHAEINSETELKHCREWPIPQ